MTKPTKKTENQSAREGGNGKEPPDYEVGYGRPPRHSQFQKGVSGNPKGKTKGRKNTKTMIREVAFAPIEIQVQGKAQKTTTFEASLMKLRQAALGGDHRALVHLLQLARSVEDVEPESAQIETSPFDSSTMIALMRDFLDNKGNSDDGEGEE